jgi:uncharacterized protein (TIGR03437 family)
VIRKLFWAACVAALAPGSPIAVRAQTTENFGGTIVLGRPTGRSITVNVLFAADQDTVYLDYGEKSGALDRQTPRRQGIKANVPYQEVISGLEPDKRYSYRVRSRKTADEAFGAGAEYGFQTQRPRGSAFTFSVIADSHLFTAQHCNPNRYALTLANARDEKPDFHIDLGDTFRTDSIVQNQDTLTYAMVLNRGIAHRPFFNILTPSAPLFLVNGNHDSEWLYYTTPASRQNPNVPLWSTNARVSLFSNPAPDDFYSGDKTVYPNVVNGGLRQAYYAWEWGDALFVALDPYWNLGQQNINNWATVHGDPQYFWFRDTLRNSKAKYKFVFEHHISGTGRGGVEAAPQYEWGGSDPSANPRSFEQSRPGWDKPMHQLLVENGATIYFQGHDHLFADAVLDGIHYVTVPMPGAGPPGSSDEFLGDPGGGWFSAYPSSVTLPSSGYLRVNVSPAGVRVDYVSTKLPNVDRGVNKSVAYTFTAGQAQPKMTVLSAASLVNAALAPAMIASAFGAGLGGAPSDRVTVAVADSKGATRPAQLLAAAPGQVNFVLPDALAPGNATVTVARSGAADVTGAIAIESVAPGIFAANSAAGGVAAALVLRVAADGSRSEQPIFDVNAPAGARRAVPIDLGGSGDQVYLELFGTGLRGAAQKPTASMAGVEIPVIGPVAHPQYAGLDQVNLGPLPRSLAGSGIVPLVLSVDGKTANVVTVTVK